MIADVFTKRTWPVTEQARQSAVHSLCLSESESHMENGLHQRLAESQSTAAQMEEIGGNSRRLIKYCPGKLVGKNTRCVGEGVGFGPRQRVRLTLERSWRDERLDCDLGDVPNINESCSARARWHEQAVVVNDIVSIGVAQVLSKEAWSEDGPSFRTKPEMLFDRAVWNEGVLSGACDGDKNNLPNPLTSCDVDERIEGPPGIGEGRRTKQEDGIATAHSTAERARVEEIERHHLDVVHRMDPARIPCADAHPNVTGAQATDDS